MTEAIAILNKVGYPLDRERLQAAAITVLSQHQAGGSRMTVVVTDDDYVASLNQQYRGVDTPTDVLSFPADVPPVADADEAGYLGDLIIAYPYAAAQAQQQVHDLAQSLMLLVVHGTLHLLGYDHDTAERRAAMWAAQDKALEALQISTAIVPALESDEHENQ
jgi:probable rRNA maturation factor